jgi:hypothetical protein
MGTAKNQLLPFPGSNDPDEPDHAAERREDARLLSCIAGGNQQALAAGIDDYDLSP